MISFKRKELFHENSKPGPYGGFFISKPSI